MGSHVITTFCNPPLPLRDLCKRPAARIELAVRIELKPMTTAHMSMVMAKNSMVLWKPHAHVVESEAL